MKQQTREQREAQVDRQVTKILAKKEAQELKLQEKATKQRLKAIAKMNATELLEYLNNKRDNKI